MYVSSWGFGWSKSAVKRKTIFDKEKEDDNVDEEFNLREFNKK